MLCFASSMMVFTPSLDCQSSFNFTKSRPARRSQDPRLRMQPAHSLKNDAEHATLDPTRHLCGDRSASGLTHGKYQRPLYQRQAYLTVDGIFTFICLHKMKNQTLSNRYIDRKDLVALLKRLFVLNYFLEVSPYGSVHIF